MKFEVLKDGHGMQTSSPSCIYDRAVLLSMQKAGYKFKIDGKAATINQVCETKEDMLNESVKSV